MVSDWPFSQTEMRESLAVILTKSNAGREAGLIDDIDNKKSLAWARFVELRNHLPPRWNAVEVANFHEIVTALEEAYGVDLSSFRIPRDRIKPRRLRAQRAPRSGQHSSAPQYSDKPNYHESFVQRQIDGLHSYCQDLDSGPPGSAELYAEPLAVTEANSSLNDSERKVAVAFEAEGATGRARAVAPPKIVGSAEVAEGLGPPPPPPDLMSMSRYGLFTTKWIQARRLGRTYSWDQFDLEQAQDKFMRDLEQRVQKRNDEPDAPAQHGIDEKNEQPSGRKGKPVRRNRRYRDIDEKLRKIAESCPSTQKEVFEALERRVVFPPAEPFKTARGWMTGFDRDKAAARSWLSKRWAELRLPPLPRGPKSPKKVKK
jgi:hypothetical protein